MDISQRSTLHGAAPCSSTSIQAPKRTQAPLPLLEVRTLKPCFAIWEQKAETRQLYGNSIVPRGLTWFSAFDDL